MVVWWRGVVVAWWCGGVLVLGSLSKYSYESLSQYFCGSLGQFRMLGQPGAFGLRRVLDLGFRGFGCRV